MSNIINPADLSSIISLICDDHNQDGKLTAGKIAKKAKNNIQQFSGDALSYTQNKIKKFFSESSIFQNYAFPKSYSAIRLIRYQKDMYYKQHTDNVILDSIRTDLSFTVFLNQPNQYEGGYLRIHHPSHIQDIKLDAGSIVIYPSDTIHEISPVTQGERLVAIGWIQSRIREHTKREVLYDLAMLRDQLSISNDHQSMFAQANHSFNRLFRMYCE